MSGPWDISPDINCRPMGHLRWVYNVSSMEHNSLSDDSSGDSITSHTWPEKRRHYADSCRHQCIKGWQFLATARALQTNWYVLLAAIAGNWCLAVAVLDPPRNGGGRVAYWEAGGHSGPGPPLHREGSWQPTEVQHSSMLSSQRFAETWVMRAISLSFCRFETIVRTRLIPIPLPLRACCRKTSLGMV